MVKSINVFKNNTSLKCHSANDQHRDGPGTIFVFEVQNNKWADVRLSKLEIQPHHNFFHVFVEAVTSSASTWLTDCSLESKLLQ